MNATVKPYNLPHTPQLQPTAEQAALLRARYDGQVKTLRQLGEETDVHWTTWRRWALELGLKNPAALQSLKEHKPWTRKTIAAVPDAPEGIEETDEEAEEPAPAYADNTEDAAAAAEAAEQEEADEEEQLVETPAPTPLPTRPEPRGSGRLPFEDRRFLGQYMERLPYTWTHEERGRWLRAFVAALDLVVEQWPPAEEKA